MLKDIFNIPEFLDKKQVNWLKMLSVIPEVKEINSDNVLPCDIKLAKEAKGVLKLKKGKAMRNKIAIRKSKELTKAK
jgi:hypothetical protein